MYKTLKNTNSQTGAIVYIGHATILTTVQDMVCKIQKNTNLQTGTTVSIGQATIPTRVQIMNKVSCPAQQNTCLDTVSSSVTFRIGYAHFVCTWSGCFLFVCLFESKLSQGRTIKQTNSHTSQLTAEKRNSFSFDVGSFARSSMFFVISAKRGPAKRQTMLGTCVCVCVCVVCVL